ncbi:MAG: metal ABC transporter permease [Clostridia bacterium]|nr:metal ABC transporter permease [Clostridia bacterium]
MLDKLSMYMQYPFVRYALITGVLIALCSSLFGATLVLKRFSFIGDGLSHVAFGAMAIAAVVGVTNDMLIILTITVLSAVGLLSLGQHAGIKGDAAVAMNLVGSLLISALIIFPALSAMRVFKSFRSVILCSAVSSVICAAMGILISVLAGTPVGSTIVAADAVVFILFSLVGLLIRKKK